MLKQTEICALNVKTNVLNALSAKGINTYNGSLGYLTNLVYGYGSVLTCLPNHDFPENFHEFQVAIIDLTNESQERYDTDKHQHKNIVSTEPFYLLCTHPQDLFDPRPFSLSMFKNEFEENLRRGFLMIVFCSGDSKVKYTSSKNKLYLLNKYSFSDNVPYTTNRIGKKTKIPKDEGEIFSFLKKYNDQFTYEITFEHPDRRVEGGAIPDPNFTPLVLTAEDKIAGISWRNDKSGIFYFPKLENQEKFLEEFLTEIAPAMFPHLFPDIVKDKWLDKEPYYLPNYSRLIDEKNQIVKDYELAIKLKNEEIEKNKLQFQFLSDMITKQSDELVESCVRFFQWIGFNKVLDADLVNKNLKEEDINIETERGLIIIEVKGLGGKTTDNDCSQIGKIRARRIEELRKFDVFGHFLVNHERHKPAATRSNPPFTPEQIKDAEYTKRGLITTWQLFNLFSAIEKGILTKEEVRSCFYRQGYLDFLPDGMISLGKPLEIMSKISVAILKLDGTATIKKKGKLMYKNGDEFKTVTIKSIMLENNEVLEANNGECGIKLNEMVPKTTVLYAYPNS